MNKQEFLKQLREAFIKYEIDEKKSEKYFNKFEKLIDEVDEKDQEAKIAELGSPDEIAKKFKELIEEKKEKRAAKKQEPAEAVEQEAPTEQDVVEKNEVVSVRGKYIFIGGLVLTSPIWISLIAAALVIFGIILAAMIVIDIIIATVMTLAIIIGGLVSACAIIYGVIGILPGAVATYIGLYELGLGLIILGSLIVSGILLHFFVIKVTPLVFRSIYRLTKFLARKIKQLVIFVRKECDKI